MSESTTIERLAQAYRAVEEERQREYEAAVKLAAEREWAELQAKLESILRSQVRELFWLRGVYTPNEQREWQRTGKAIRDWRIDLTPRNLPEGVDITLLGRLTSAIGLFTSAGEQIAVGRFDPMQHRMSSIFLEAGQTADDQLHALASLILPEIERQQNAARERAEKERQEEERKRAWAEAERRRAEQEQAERERRARHLAAVKAAKARLRERIPAVRAELEARRAADVAERGWPEGARLTLYHIRWIAGVDADGDDTAYDWYSAYPTPDANGWWRVLKSDGERRLRIDSPNGYMVEELVIDDPRSLPEWWMRQEQHYSDAIFEELPEDVRLDDSEHDRAWEHVEIAPAKLLHPLIAELLHKQAARPTGGDSV